MNAAAPKIDFSINAPAMKEARREIVREWVTEWFAAYLNHNLSWSDVRVSYRGDYEEIKIFVPAPLVSQAEAQTDGMEQELSEAGFPALVYVLVPAP